MQSLKLIKSKHPTLPNQGTFYNIKGQFSSLVSRLCNHKSPAHYSREWSQTRLSFTVTQSLKNLIEIRTSNSISFTWSNRASPCITALSTEIFTEWIIQWTITSLNKKRIFIGSRDLNVPGCLASGMAVLSSSTDVLTLLISWLGFPLCEWLCSQPGFSPGSSCFTSMATPRERKHLSPSSASKVPGFTLLGLTWVHAL